MLLLTQSCFIPDASCGTLSTPASGAGWVIYMPFFSSLCGPRRPQLHGGMLCLLTA